MARSGLGFSILRGGLGVAAICYVGVDYLRKISPSWHALLQPILWSVLALAAICRAPFYPHWSTELRSALPFVGSLLFMLSALAVEAISVQFVTAVLGLDWHRTAPPLPDTGQWLFLALNEKLPLTIVQVLRAPLIGLHHYLMLFLMLAFSVLFDCVKAPGLGLGARYMFTMAVGRLLRVMTFVATILPSARPWCASARFDIPNHPHPWAQKYYMPYSSDPNMIRQLLQHDMVNVPVEEYPAEIIPDWGWMKFLVNILRPTSLSTSDETSWFNTLKRAGGGCNDLVYSGHMLVAVLTAMAWTEAYPGWTSAVIWFLVLHSAQREIRERHHYSVDCVGAIYVGILLWRTTSFIWSAKDQSKKLKLERLANVEGRLVQAAKDADIEKVRELLSQVSRLSSDRAESFLSRNSRRVWKTLNGNMPLVIARGGLSGLFPDHTTNAYEVAMNNSLPTVVLFCDVQLTKDGKGICRTDLRLDNSTDIAELFKNQKNSYIVNGKNITGWFSVDFTFEQILSNVSAKQSFTSRPDMFDGLPLLPVEGVDSLGPPALWLNVQYSMFFEDHKLSMIQYVLSTAKSVILDYISSPEVDFLRKVRLGLRKRNSKLVLRFLDKEDIEPSTNQTYGIILKNLTFVKSFASGILVPKNYIWPLDDSLYLQTPTTLVQDAHKAGLEVYASDFANDEYDMSYNYSYDPVREYLQFLDNTDFAVDGVLTDFSVTASEAIACYAHGRKNLSSTAGKPLIISHNGASGDFPGCTDIAYQSAIQDGVDYIDCSVQMTKDGVPICREDPDLLISTNVLSDSSFYPARQRTVSDIQAIEGIFTFDLTWKEIQGLKPQIYSPFGKDGYGLYRNPSNMYHGKFMTLSDFLELGKGEDNVGVLVDIQNARYLASKRGLDVTSAVVDALKEAGYDKMTERVLIQSDDSAVLRKLRQNTTGYKLVYHIANPNVTVPDSSIKEIKEFADTVTLSRNTILTFSEFFLINDTGIVSRMHLHNLTVFVFRLRNEFPSLAFDYLADPTMEINTFVNVVKVDGLITEYPATARAYMNNACLHPRRKSDYSMFLVEPGALLAVMPPSKLPVVAPAPTLEDVIDPPLPSATVAPATNNSVASAPIKAATSKNGHPNVNAYYNHLFSSISILFSMVILLFFDFL